MIEYVIVTPPDAPVEVVDGLNKTNVIFPELGTTNCNTTALFAANV